MREKVIVKERGTRDDPETVRKRKSQKEIEGRKKTREGMWGGIDEVRQVRLPPTHRQTKSWSVETVKLLEP